MNKTIKREIRRQPPPSAAAGLALARGGFHGHLTSDPSGMLSALEIVAFTFCPQAWYLKRCRVPMTPEADTRRRAGSRRHREIGRQTNDVGAAGALQAMLLMAISLVLLRVAALMLRGPG